jgi:SAM-dependent methyltransferase
MGFRESNIDGLIEAVRLLKGSLGLLVGAGCSVSAGIPAVAGIIKKIAERLHKPPSWNPSYSEALDALGDAAVQRAFFEELIAGVAHGAIHRDIAALAARKWTTMIFTTNFDQLVEKALPHEDINSFTANNTQAAREILGNKRLEDRVCVVKLHGDRDYRDLQIHPHEVAQLRDGFSQLFEKWLDQHGLVIVGYGIGDASVKDALGKAAADRGKLQDGLYWVERDCDVTPTWVHELAARRSDAWLNRVRVKDAETLFSQIAAAAIGTVAGPGSPAGDLDLIQRFVYDELQKRLEATRAIMVEKGECDHLASEIFYQAKSRAVATVKRGGRVRAVNILDHREWEHESFSNKYLNAERDARDERDLRIERFFVGTVEQFEIPHVKELMRDHAKSRIAVRRVYTNVVVGEKRVFARDVAFHESEPECLTEGLYGEPAEPPGDPDPRRYFLYGRVRTRDVRQEADPIFKALEAYSPALPDYSLKHQTQISENHREWYAAHDSNRVLDRLCPILADGDYLKSVIESVSTDPRDREPDRCRIMDLGCGGGANLRYCADVCAHLAEANPAGARFIVTGVDFVDGALVLAKSRVMGEPAPPVTCHFRSSDITQDLPAVTDSIDLLYCIDTFSHLYPSDNYRGTLCEWMRVLRPGGRLLVSVLTADDPTRQTILNLFSLTDAEREGGAYWRKKRPVEAVDAHAGRRWYRFFEEAEFKALFERAGFEQVSVRPFVAAGEPSRYLIADAKKPCPPTPLAGAPGAPS